MRPRILFVPVSGAGGAGEFMRSLIVARALRERWPDAGIHFVVNAAAGYARDLEFPSTIIEGSPTYNVAAVNATLVRERPHVVIFDSAGRVAQYAAARALGARVIYVSSRFKTRWKGFRLRRMRYIDQHWIAQPRFLGAGLTGWERLKLRLMRHLQPIFLEVLFESSDTARQERVLASMQLRPHRYVVLCIGSGGRYAHRADAPAILLSAAERIHRATGLRCVVVAGANAPSPLPSPAGVHCVVSLPNGELMDLLDGAQVAVVNGGSLLLQAIANRVPTVAVPVAGDQADRIRGCVAFGLTVASALDADAIAHHIVQLVTNERRMSTLRDALERLDLQNGVATAVAAVAGLLADERSA